MKATKRLAVVPLRPGYCRSYSTTGRSAAEQEQTAQLFEDVMLHPNKSVVTRGLRRIFENSNTLQLQMKDARGRVIKQIGKPRETVEDYAIRQLEERRRNLTDFASGLQTFKSLKTTGSKASNNNLSTKDPIRIVVAKGSTSNWTKGLPEELGVSIFKEKDASAILPSKVHVHLPDQIPASLLPLHNSLPYCVEGNDSATCAEAMLKSLKVEGLGNSWFNTTRQLLKSLVTQKEGWRPEPAVDFF